MERPSRRSAGGHMLNIKLLGCFRVTLDGRLVDIPSRPSQLLLAYLLLNAGTPHPREEMADILWPDSSADNARANLRHALWQLRSAIEDTDDPQTIAIVHDAHAIAFNRHSAYALDVDALRQERPVWTTAALMEAAAAYGGELLPGFYESWIVLEREQLAVVFDRRMGRLLERLIAERRWDDTLAWAERWIELGDAPEPAYRALMRAYAALSDTSGVMVTYRRCREALLEGLGIEPSLETRQLVESLTHSGPPAAEARFGVEGNAGAMTAREAARRVVVSGDRHVVEAALARAKAERQRANGYRLALGLMTLLTTAMAAALATRRRKP